MNFHSINLEHATSRLQKMTGDIVSVCLPFGISGVDEKKFAIQRKNTLVELKSQLEAKELTENHLKFLKKIEKFSSTMGSERVQESLPCTKLYFFNESEGLLLSLNSSLRAHFLISDIAEIEPVYYCESRMGPESYLIDLDLNGPTLLNIKAGHHKELPVQMTSEYAGDEEVYLKDTSLKASTKMSDRNRGNNQALDKGNQTVTYGLSSREKTHEQKNREYWMRMIALAINEEVVSGAPIFVHGVEYLVSEFRAVTKNILKLSDVKIKHQEKRSKKELVESVEEHLRASSEFKTPERALISDTLEMYKILETGQCKELLLSENDWFVKTEANQDIYSYRDQRSKLISKALKHGTNIRFVDSSALKDCNVAAVSY